MRSAFFVLVSSLVVVAIPRIAEAESGDVQTSCRSSSDCLCDSVCNSSYCAWNPTAARTDGIACSTDTDCRPICGPVTCVNSVCTRRTCATSDDCSCTDRCEAGQCVRAPYGWPIGATCTTGAECRPSCGSLVCAEQTCVTACTSSAICGCNASCRSGGCVPGPVPQVGTVCVSHDDCRTNCTGLLCDRGACAAPFDAGVTDGGELQDAGVVIDSVVSDTGPGAHPSACACRTAAHRARASHGHFMLLLVAMVLGLRRRADHPTGPSPRRPPVPRPST